MKITQTAVKNTTHFLIELDFSYAGLHTYIRNVKFYKKDVEIQWLVPLFLLFS